MSLAVAPLLDHPAIRTVDMRVDYGNFVAVEGLNLEIPAGEIYGLVGPNGAGKTSTFKVLSTLLEPTYGEVFLKGIDIAEYPRQARHQLGYMPDMAPVPSDLKVFEFLEMFAAAHGIKGRTRKDRVAECLGHVKLVEKREAYCGSLSRGMKQRLVLAKTMLHRPSILVLDEPASGMDPISRAALRRTLKLLAREGSTVIISSHILTELTDMCTSVGIMSHGRLLSSGPIDEVIDQFTEAARTIAISCTDQQSREKVMNILEETPDVSQLERLGPEIHFHFSGTSTNQAALLSELVRKGISLKTFSEKRSNIEDVLLLIESNSEEGSAP